MSRIRLIIVTVVSSLLLMMVTPTLANEEQQAIDFRTMEDSALVTTLPDMEAITQNTEWYFSRAGNTVSSKKESYYYRKVVKKLPQDIMVQDFYTKTNNKYTDPYITANPSVWFSKKLLKGAYVVWYNNKKKMYQDRFVEGALDNLSNQAIWYASGKKHTEVVKHNGQQLLVSWYETGKKWSEVALVDGKRQGVAIYWTPEGQKQSEITFRNGLPSKMVTYYTTSGQKQSEIYYKNNKRHGVAMEWYESRHKMSETPYEHDRIQGVKRVWYETGQKQAEMIYKKGQKLKAANWYVNGQQESVCEYDDANEGNSCKKWDDTGMSI